ncbi:MAG: metal-sensitive transcriptional regulator [Pseudomonadota bacterium]
MPRHRKIAPEDSPQGEARHSHGDADARARIVNRLRRIEGQVAGVARMIDDDRYCIDILTQLQAVKAALSKVEDAVLQDHAAHCVAAAIRSGNADDQHAKFSELVELFAKVKR